jgi:hypothetical protein
MSSVSTHLSGDSVETLTPRSRCRIFYALAKRSNMEANMQCAEGKKAKRGNDRLVAFSNAKPSHGVLAVRATPSRRVQEARLHKPAPPWERFEGLVV